MRILPHHPARRPPKPKPWPGPDDPDHPFPPVRRTRVITRAIAYSGGVPWLMFRAAVIILWVAADDPYLVVN